MSLPAYQSYKNSGIEWLGDIPAHWDAIQVRRDLAFLTSGSRGWAEYYSDEGFIFLRIGNLTRDGIGLDLKDIQRVNPPPGTEGDRTEVANGDVLFSITAYLGSVAVVPNDLERSYVSQHVCLARLLRKKLTPQWLAYSVLSSSGKAYLESESYGGTKVQLSLDDIKSFPVPLPSIDEQRLLTNFLDRETAKIDALIAEQQRLIELLQEKRQAVISHAVIKGLSPNVPLKDSGVEWLGEVPEHWEVKQVRHLVKSLSQGSSPSCLQEPAGDDEYGVLKVGCVNEIAFLTMENKKLPPEIEPDLASLVEPGDVLVSRGNTKELVGLAALATEAPQRLLASDLIFVLRTRCRQIHPHFLTLALRSQNTRAQIEPRTVGTSPSMQKINQSTLKEILVAVPPLAEQQEIIDVLNEWNGSSEKGIHDSRLAIQLLQERRSALISAAVSGQIDVRGLVEAEGS